MYDLSVLEGAIKVLSLESYMYVGTVLTQRTRDGTAISHDVCERSEIMSARAVRFTFGRVIM